MHWPCRLETTSTLEVGDALWLAFALARFPAMLYSPLSILGFRVTE